MSTYLLDTNVLFEGAKTSPDKNVMAMLEKHRDEIATASLVWHELRYGCRRLPRSRKRELIETYLRDVIWQNLDILPYDERAAEWHAEQRAKLTARGKPPSFADGQIAAIAKVNGLTLVTRNVSDFAIFENLEVRSWHESD